MTERFIELSAVTLTLGKQQFAFDLTIPEGKVTAITGPSGSGKSTLLNLISGFEAADSGTIRIAGEDVTGKLPSERPVASIFQDHNLFAHLDVFTNVALGTSANLRLSATQKQSVHEALKRVGLGGFEKRMPGDLSGGERQRAAIARALVQNQPLILLDEPFAALDPSLRRDMGQLLLDLQREEGRTLLLVTHQPDEVARLADEVIFLESGHILFVGAKVHFMQQHEIPAIGKFLSV